MNKTNRVAQVALLGLGFCLLLTAGVVLQSAKSAQLEGLQDALAGKQRQLEDARLQAKEVPVLEARYETLGNQIAMLEPALPTEAYMPTFLSQIQLLAAQTDNHLTLIRPDPKQRLVAATAVPESAAASSGKPARPSKPAASPYDAVCIALEMEGTFSSTLDFLEKLQQFPKMIAINELSLKPETTIGSTGTVDNPMLQVSLQLTAVMAKEK